MVEKIFFTFLGLVAFYFVLSYPEKIVEFLQLFVDAANRVAQALSQLNTHTQTVKGK